MHVRKVNIRRAYGLIRRGYISNIRSIFKHWSEDCILKLREYYANIFHGVKTFIDVIIDDCVTKGIMTEEQRKALYDGTLKDKEDEHSRFSKETS